ncbi:MAG: hypothetical protein ACE5JF_09705, partial [Anaerolineales bacterium]
KRGSFYSYKEDRLGQGRENTKEFLREHPDILDELDHRIRAEAGGELEDEPSDSSIAHEESAAKQESMDSSEEPGAAKKKSKAAETNGRAQQEVSA